MCEVIEYPRTGDWRDRIRRTEEIIVGLHLEKGSKILDIGGNDYKNLCTKLNYKYIMLDLEKPQNTGLGGYNKDKDGLTYDGRNLPFNKKEFDMVIVNFVFHHASNNTFALLRQIKEIAKKYILVGEDLAELNYEIGWHKRNFEHQPGGIFRSDEEWRELFKIFGYKLKRQYVIRRNDDIDKKKVYRCMYLLEV